MNENGNESAMIDPEWGVDLSDLITDEDDNHSETSDEAAETPDTEADEAEVTEDEAETTETAHDTEAEPQQVATEQAAPDVYELKFNHETMAVDRSKVTELAQKGLDYDRIRTQRDELTKFKEEHADMVEFVKSLAQENGMTPDAMLDRLRANQYMQKGMSEDAATERVAREKAERKLTAVNQKQTEQEKNQQAVLDEKQRRDADIQAFFSKFPGVSPNDIPKTVWDAVNRGEPLVSAYQAHKSAELKAENERLKAQLAAKAKNETNRKKTVGTQATGGQETAKDAFLDALFG